MASSSFHTRMNDFSPQKNYQEGFPGQHQIDNNDQYPPNNHQEQYKNLQEFISLNERDSHLNKREPLLDKNKRESDLNEKEFDSTITPCELDSSLFIHPTFSTSPIFEPAVNFSSKLSDGNNTKSTMHLTSTVPSAADPFSMFIRQLSLTSALNIPCDSDVINTPSIASDGTMSSVSLMNTRNTLTSPLSSTKFSPAVIVPSKLSQTKFANSRSRENEVVKDPETISEELAIKRAKNDSARKSRLQGIKRREH
ncbi:10638_t:CDS:2 [Gigaspora margarita]|uniref:10638_t:CDS:1 n=1 Tax=Gigaspora margarita TaxID=4874 RepID=A0ABM8W3V5_GIGMA|nr:10638_t:CDS:2 [Gigaspora margarita]